MEQGRSAKQVFEAWGKDYHAEGMENEHWPRVRQIFDLIPESDGNYLEIGVGNGYGLVHMAGHQFSKGRCLGMDLSASMVELARERTKEFANVDVEVGDFLAWDFAGTRFDAIFSMEVFYYFQDIEAGVRKSISILKPGGTLWVAVNFYGENEQSADWPERVGTPMMRWSMRDYFDSFERNGFTAVEQRLIAAPPPEGSTHGDAPTLLTAGTRPR